VLPSSREIKETLVALNIKNVEVERLVAEIAAMTGESKTQAIRTALEERRDRLAFRIVPSERRAHLRRFLEREIWANIPGDQLGRLHDPELDDEILGYGPDGV
jgi:antitoxin VapB